MRRIIAAVGVVLCVCASAATGAQAQPAESNGSSAAAPAEARPPLDPLAFFEQLVERYRQLAAYEDTADVVQITTRSGEDPCRVETRIACKIENETLRVETPGSQVRDDIGIDVPIKKSPAMEALVLRYNLWLAPHMALRFTEEPLEDFRLGVQEGFTPTKAEHVAVEKKQMVHVQLKSGDGLSEDYTAKFDLLINPKSMLIEHIEGEQRLPDGADYRTTLDITPILAEQGEPAKQPPSTD